MPQNVREWEDLIMSDELLIELIKAIRAQTDAISALANSNIELIAAMADCDDEGSPQRYYMDGTPVRQ